MGARGRMTTGLGSPDIDELRASVAEMERWASEEAEDASSKGHEGPLPQRGRVSTVKPRSKCKVCNACPHGKWRNYCKECGGSQPASTVVSVTGARSAVGLNLRARSSALSKEAAGGICSTVVTP